ncbi:type II toxin-antitoxin system HipA family toxin [Sulfuricurvum sp.]|uniref:type II toxin-antitoxin system HipA family toxin n=2 Tax=Sulfuricurvum sp. TaxID=2025608 RepID=UPI00262BD4B2|nr:type II toxin-antitoxin system HipA family toxin [Sulfuricurvum sp.]MDD4949119.1 type II toxin-antitoxin system HipA family toxin [Sulfuricurvum sp.]
MADKLKVYTNKTLSGELSKEDGNYIFNYLSDSQELVSLTMPIRAESWVSKSLHPIFQMNMPEGALKDVIKNHFAKIVTMDEINLLKLIGPYMLGRVKFEKIISDTDVLELEEIVHSSKQNLFNELMEKFAIRSGVSGVQPKLLLGAHNKTTMKFEHYIVKSWEKEYPNLALNEYFCMRAIQNAHLPTPEFYLSDDYSMFIMKRFDVKEEGTYLGFEDMCVLSGRGTEQKYEGSYEECARIIKDVIAPQKLKESLRVFFKALVMNHFLQNGDGHLKNYGILYENDFTDSFLAPIYDVITTTVYIQNDIPALKMSDAKLWWKEKTYKNFAKLSCGLSNKEYETILLECAEALRKTKDEMDAFETNDASVLQFLDKLRGCWRESF